MNVEVTAWRNWVGGVSAGMGAKTHQTSKKSILMIMNE